MPNRILKESICTSDSIDSLSEFQEIFFYRLITACDDFGRMDARPRILAARLFPLKEYDYASDYAIETALEKLQKGGLITLYTVDKRPYLVMNTWEKHQQIRAHKSKYPAPTDDCVTDDSTCNQMISSDYKCPRNPIQSESISESESYSLSDNEAHRIQQEQNRVLDAAENAGFQRSNTVHARLIALYASNGLEKMLNGIESCATHGATNLAYLEAVLMGKPKQAKPKVEAQNYEQRDYAEMVEEVLADQDREMEEWLKNKSG